MKQSKLKTLVEMIVQRTFAEMHDSHTTENDSLVTIEGIKLPDGRTVSANVGIEGHWDDGAFQHAFGTHRYPVQFEIDSHRVEQVVDTATNQVVPLTPEIVQLVSAEFEEIESEVADEINQNPPD